MLTTVQRLARGAAEVIAAYRRELEDGGASSIEASALANHLEELLLRPIVGDPPIEVRPAPWADIEAFFVAVVHLQLALGHPLDPAAAVDYMRRAGIDLPDISPAGARRLARRVPIPPTAVFSSFQFARLIEDRLRR